MVKKVGLLFLIGIVLSLSTACKKQTENRLLGTWERVNIDNPFSSVFQYWYFVDAGMLTIHFYDQETDLIFRVDTFQYAVPSKSKINMWKEGSVDNVRHFEIKKIKRKVLAIIESQGLVTANTYEFTKNNDFLSSKM